MKKFRGIEVWSKDQRKGILTLWPNGLYLSLFFPFPGSYWQRLKQCIKAAPHTKGI